MPAACSLRLWLLGAADAWLPPESLATVSANGSREKGEVVEAVRRGGDGQRLGCDQTEQQLSACCSHGMVGGAGTARLGMASDSGRVRADADTSDEIRSSQYAPWPRGAVLFVVAAALCALVFSFLVDDAITSRSGAMGHRRQLSMLDDDDNIGGGGDDDDNSFGGGDGDGGFGNGMSAYSPTDSLEDSGNYVGYLAWSDDKVQRVLNSTRMHFYNFAKTWNETFAPVQMHAMEDKIWRLKHAFGNKGYLVDDSEKGLQSLHTYTSRSIRNLEDKMGAMAPQMNRELALIKNRTHALLAREAAAVAEQGRRIIRAEQIDLRTNAAVRHKITEAQHMLASLEVRQRNVTATMMDSALEFGRVAATDMHSPTVLAALHKLPQKFSIHKLAVQAVREEDMVHRKVATELRKLGDMEMKEQRLVSRANLTTLELQGSDLHAASLLYQKDKRDEAKERRFWVELKDSEVHILKKPALRDCVYRRCEGADL